MREITAPHIERYLLELSQPISGVLGRIEQEAREEGIPIMSRPAMQLVTACLQIRNPSRILEIGTAVGYSAIQMAVHVPGASITTLEIDPARACRAEAHFAEAGIADRVECRCGDALELLPQLQGTYDAILIDAAKGQYIRYLELCLPLLAPRGVLISDNVLFRGMVALDESEVPARYRSLVRRLKEYNRKLAEHPHLQTVFVPVGDGVAISVRDSG